MSARKKLNRDDAARAVADDTDASVVPVPVRMRLPFQQATRWLVLDARKLPSRQPAAK